MAGQEGRESGGRGGGGTAGSDRAEQTAPVGGQSLVCAVVCGVCTVRSQCVSVDEDHECGRTPRAGPARLMSCRERVPRRPALCRLLLLGLLLTAISQVRTHSGTVTKICSSLIFRAAL